MILLHIEEIQISILSELQFRRKIHKQNLVVQKKKKNCVLQLRDYLKRIIVLLISKPTRTACNENKAPNFFYSFSIFFNFFFFWNTKFPSN